MLKEEIKGGEGEGQKQTWRDSQAETDKLITRRRGRYADAMKQNNNHLYTNKQ